MIRFILVIYVLFTLHLTAYSQTTASFAPTEDVHYYDFWAGNWQKLVDGKIDTAADYFQVKRGVHAASFEENWRMVLAANRIVYAQALRAWDQATQKWMYTWISDTGLYQVWEGKKIGSDWYIYRNFNIDGDKYLSRQAWLPDGPERLIRISEKSYDEGKTWQLRFKEYYQRKKESPNSIK
ncbi:hypothetical protein IC229_33075 [Spirosoma sp. BT702]|uniref:DUF1579 domain-containing protein n=1 Tax=Spirosoma profusum TaxID=2771354 RepID=A0A927AW69_9BACT|nr:hypothetical protein [Spirosoma profusum]MBD2705491.1 hypothetical protein [Spirosoma profusum]